MTSRVMPYQLRRLLSATDEQHTVVAVQILEGHDEKVTIVSQMVLLVLDPPLACVMAAGCSFVALRREMYHKLVLVRAAAREGGTGCWWLPSWSLRRCRVGAVCADAGYVCGTLAREANLVGLRVFHDQGFCLSLLTATHERPRTQLDAVVRQESQNGAR